MNNGLKWDSNGDDFRITFFLDVKNTGRSPAIDAATHMNIMILFEEDEKRVTKAVRQFSDRAVSGKHHVGHHYTIFPGSDDFPQPCSLLTTKNTIDEFAKAREDTELPVDAVWFYIFGCVVYRYDLTGATHCTGFAYELKLADDRSFEYGGAPFRLDAGDIVANKIRVYRTAVPLPVS